MLEMFCASSTTAPAPAVRTSLSSRYAFALASTRLVAIVPLIDHPPDELAAVSATAAMAACSSAVTVTEPAPTVPATLPRTSAFLRYACTSLRTSFLTTSPPMAIDSASSSASAIPSGIRFEADSSFQKP